MLKQVVVMVRPQRNPMSLEECQKTVKDDKKIRTEFKKDILKIIEGMHKFGFAFGAYNKGKIQSGFRTFHDQYVQTNTNSGPGESAHNYGIAVDLGVLQWIDKNNNVWGNSSDFWLDRMFWNINYLGFSDILWQKSFDFVKNGHKVYRYKDYEIIHLMNVKGSYRFRNNYKDLLNWSAQKNGNRMWKYSRRGKNYYCNLGGIVTIYKLGTAKQLWEAKDLKDFKLDDLKIRNSLLNIEKQKEIFKIIKKHIEIASKNASKFNVVDFGNV